MAICDKGTFVLSLGAQKSGTTWLYSYLNSHDFADFGFTKEYHVFDLATLEQRRAALVKQCEALSARLASGPEHVRKNLLQRINFIINPGAYYDYFVARLAQPEVSLTGDMTPSYGALPAETMASIRREFEQRGILIRPILVIRDPVYRLHSMVRMSHRNRGLLPSKEEELAAMRRRQLSRGDCIRVDYPSMIKRADEAFGREGYHLELFEDLFTEPAIHRLQEFLGVPLGPAPLGQRANTSDTNNRLTEAEYAFFQERYEPIYEEVKRMTSFDIERMWRFRPSN